MERSNPVVVINHRISRNTTVRTRARTVTDDEHREQAAYTAGSLARPLYRQRQKRRRDCVVIEYRGPSSAISYTIFVCMYTHTYARSLPIYLFARIARPFANVTHKPHFFFAQSGSEIFVDGSIIPVPDGIDFRFDFVIRL